jgi:hypothetical protein
MSTNAQMDFGVERMNATYIVTLDVELGVTTILLARLAVVTFKQGKSNYIVRQDVKCGATTTSLASLGVVTSSPF